MTDDSTPETSRIDSTTRRGALAALGGAGLLAALGGSAQADVGGGPQSSEISHLLSRFYEGPESELPDAGVEGRRYLVTDTGGSYPLWSILRDDGSSWSKTDLGVGAFESDSVSTERANNIYSSKENGGLQSAIDAASAGDMVVFDADETVASEVFSTQSDITILGAGAVLTQSTDDEAGLAFDGVSNVTVSGMVLHGPNPSSRTDGSGFADHADGIVFNNSTEICVENCYVKEFGGDGIDFWGTTDSVMRDCTAENVKDDGLQLAAGADRSKIINGISRNPDQTGIYVGGSVEVEADAISRGAGDHGLVVAGSDGVQRSEFDVTVTNAASNGVRLDSPDNSELQFKVDIESSGADGFSIRSAVEEVKLRGIIQNSAVHDVGIQADTTDLTANLIVNGDGTSGCVTITGGASVSNLTFDGRYTGANRGYWDTEGADQVDLKGIWTGNGTDMIVDDAATNLRIDAQFGSSSFGTADVVTADYSAP